LPFDIEKKILFQDAFASENSGNIKKYSSESATLAIVPCSIPEKVLTALLLLM
jgi:hypothetical protein